MVYKGMGVLFKGEGGFIKGCFLGRVFKEVGWGREYDGVVVVVWGFKVRGRDEGEGGGGRLLFG